MEQIIYLLWTLVAICYIGFGFMNVVLLQTEMKEKLPSPAVRIIFFLLWPVFVFMYLWKGE